MRQLQSQNLIICHCGRQAALNIAFDFKARARHALKNRVALSTGQRREIEHDIAGQQPVRLAAVKKKSTWH